MQILIHLELESNIVQDFILYGIVYRRYSFSSKHTLTAFDHIIVNAVLGFSCSIFPQSFWSQRSRTPLPRQRGQQYLIHSRGIFMMLLIRQSCGLCSWVLVGVEGTEEERTGCGAGSLAKWGWKWPLLLLDINILKTATGRIWDCGLSCDGHFHVCNCSHFVCLL